MIMINKSKMIGKFAGKFVRCPKCYSELLENGMGYRWCPTRYCDYHEIN